MSRHVRQRAAWMSLGLLLLLSAPGLAQKGARLALEGDAACPSRQLVRAALRPLLRGYQLVENEPELTAKIVDLGESYSVSIQGAVRTVHDPARLCLERARVAAVFIALNLPPGTRDASRAATDSNEPAARDQVAPEAPPPDPAERAHLLDLRVFGFAEAAPRADVIAIGGGLGVSRRLGSWRFTVLGGVATPTAPNQGDGEAARFEMLRMPLALLLGLESDGDRFGLGAEAGLALDMLRFEGKQVPHPEASWRVNPGLRFDVALRLRGSRRLAALLLPGFSYFPRTYVLRIAPARILGETPRWWLGANLGLEYGF